MWEKEWRGKTEDQRRTATCLRSHSRLAAEPGLKCFSLESFPYNLIMSNIYGASFYVWKCSKHLRHVSSSSLSTAPQERY